MYPSISAAAKAHGLSSSVVVTRLKKGWSIEEAVGVKTAPERKPQSGRKIICAGTEFISLTAFAKHYKLSREVVKNRDRSGWTMEQIAGLVEPPKGNRVPQKVACAQQEFRSVAALAKHYGKPSSRIQTLLDRGFSTEQAVGLV